MTICSKKCLEKDKFILNHLFLIHIFHCYFPYYASSLETVISWKQMTLSTVNMKLVPNEIKQAWKTLRLLQQKRARLKKFEIKLAEEQEQGVQCVTVEPPASGANSLMQQGRECLHIPIVGVICTLKLDSTPAHTQGLGERGCWSPRRLHFTEMVLNCSKRKYL